MNKTKNKISSNTIFPFYHYLKHQNFSLYLKESFNKKQMIFKTILFFIMAVIVLLPCLMLWLNWKDIQYVEGFGPKGWFHEDLWTKWNGTQIVGLFHLNDLNLVIVLAVILLILLISCYFCVFQNILTLVSCGMVIHAFLFTAIENIANNMSTLDYWYKAIFFGNMQDAFGIIGSWIMAFSILAHLVILIGSKIANKVNKNYQFSKKK